MWKRLVAELSLDKLVLKGIASGNLEARNDDAVRLSHGCEHGMSERRACRLVNQPRGTQRYRPTLREDEDALTQVIIQLASQYGRYGYRRITALLQSAGCRWARIEWNASGVAKG